MEELPNGIILGNQVGYLGLTPDIVENLVCTDPITDYFEVESTPFARGKFAAVRLVRCLRTGECYAAKVVRKRRRARDVRSEALHEAAVLALAQDSQRIVKLHKVFEGPSEMTLVLELASGGELQRVIDEEERIDERIVKKHLIQILTALKFLHSYHIAHLDLKPQNLLLMGSHHSSDVKLCDFGISRIILSNIEVREVLGTPDYVAPEILQYEPISLATDMWSVGVLAYVLLTGHSPFGGDTKQETFLNISQCQLDFPEELFDGVSPEAKEFISKLLIVEPSARLSVNEALAHPWLFSLSLGYTPSPKTIVLPEGIISPISSPTCPSKRQNCSPKHSTSSPSNKENNKNFLNCYLEGGGISPPSKRECRDPHECQSESKSNASTPATIHRSVVELCLSTSLPSIVHNSSSKSSSPLNSPSKSRSPLNSPSISRSMLSPPKSPSYTSSPIHSPSTSRRAAGSEGRVSNQIKNFEKRLKSKEEMRNSLSPDRECPLSHSPICSKSNSVSSLKAKFLNDVDGGRTSFKKSNLNRSFGSVDRPDAKEKINGHFSGTLRLSPLCLRREGQKCDISSPKDQKKKKFGARREFQDIVLEKSLIY